MKLYLLLTYEELKPKNEAKLIFEEFNLLLTYEELKPL